MWGKQEVGRFDRGWVKADRDDADTDLMGNMCLWALWNWLLRAATWKPSLILWEGKQREIPAHSVVFSPKELAERWQCSRSVIQKWLKHLHDTGRLVATTCPRGTLVTLCNQNIYNESENPEITSSWQQRNNSVATACEQRGSNEALIKESKKEELKKEEGDPARAKPLSPLREDPPREPSNQIEKTEDPPPRPTPTRSEIESCKETWKTTLAAAGSPVSGNLSLPEEVEIAKAVRLYGADDVLLALLGARHEPKFEGFNPKDHTSLRRVFGRDKEGKLRFPDFVGWGRKARLQEEQQREKEAKKQEPADEDAPFADPEKIREIRAKMRGILGGNFP